MLSGCSAWASPGWGPRKPSPPPPARRALPRLLNPAESDAGVIWQGLLSVPGIMQPPGSPLGVTRIQGVVGGRGQPRAESDFLKVSLLAGQLPESPLSQVRARGVVKAPGP